MFILLPLYSIFFFFQFHTEHCVRYMTSIQENWTKGNDYKIFAIEFI